MVFTACAMAFAKESPSDWKTEAAKAGLTPEEITRLEKDKVLVSRREKAQSFSAYVANEAAPFITSDAVLNGYHVLFEETLRLREETNAVILRQLWHQIWITLPQAKTLYTGDKSAIAASYQRAQFVVGVALKLLGEDPGNAPDLLRHKIEEEAAAITKAEGQRKPALLGEPEPDFVAFDYTLFRPVGFYDSSDTLRRHFRAVRWLQLVPFRVEKPTEWLALQMLKGCESFDLSSPAQGEKTYQLWSDYFLNTYQLLGPSGDWEYGKMRQYGDGPSINVNDDLFRSAVKDANERLQGMSPDQIPQLNDRICQKPADGKWQPEFRLLESLVLPEQNAMSLARTKPDTAPCGALEFCAWLGLPLAEKLLSASDPARLALLTQHRPEPQIDYDKHDSKEVPWWTFPGNHRAVTALRAILRYLELPDPRAPAFMKGTPWQTKTLQTVASSWAQDRHAWVLQTKPEVYFLGGTLQPSGFVEPAPLFFQHLSFLARQMGELASSLEANADPLESIIQEALTLAKEQRQTASGKMSREEVFSAVWEADQFTGKYQIHDAQTDKATRAYHEMMRHSPDEKPAEEPPLATAEDLRANAARFEKFAATLRAEALPGTALWRRVQKGRRHLDALWHQLEILCMQLSFLAEKQLDGRDFSGEERGLIKNFGEQLSEIMLYRGEAYISPPDNAPRITRISSDPHSQKTFQVGIGRPRLLFVLYPWKEQEIFCQGVVMPYHEVNESTTLTDAEWRKRFTEKPRPPVPDWLKDFVPTEAKLDPERH